MNNFKEKVYGMWLGKAIGGTLGMPWEGCSSPLSLTFYTPEPTEMMPNDDLDLQILWACKLSTDWNYKINRQRFAEAWRDCVRFPFDEYGIALRNISIGLKPPYTGSYDNWFVDGLGAAIRSELWAALAPGDPAKAVAYAYEDACVDHKGDGLYAEQYLAALEAMAFCSSNIPELIGNALQYIPCNCRLFEAICDTIGWCTQSSDPLIIRKQILDKYGVTNFTDVKMNIPFMVAALLLSEGDFEKAICTAVNFGEDADCTGATVGAIMGIIAYDKIPERWKQPIGDNIVVSKEISGINPPKTIAEFTELVLELKEKVSLEVEESPAPDFARYKISAEKYIFRPWFGKDYRRFPIQVEQKIVDYIKLPGNYFTVDLKEVMPDGIMLITVPFIISKAGKYRVMCNSNANLHVYVDKNYQFGREFGDMVPSYHRAPLNQSCDLELSAGVHKMTICLAPSNTTQEKAEVVFGIGDENNLWVPDAFVRG